MKKLCLIDASAYIHRAFHAIPLLTTSKGEPVNALYGYMRMVSKIVKEEKPDFIGICFDTPAPTFRHESYKEYKATRSELDPTLGIQLPLTEELTREWGLSCVKLDGYEADDVIATLAVSGKKAGMDVLIYSGDKDILQLVEKNVRVRDEMKRVEYDEAKVEERFGFKPNMLIDYFCLVGDKVDNVMGVPGVGDKTATKLIVSHGSLENIYANMDLNPDALKQKLLANKDHVFGNRHLIELDKKVPLTVSVNDLAPRQNSARFAELLKRFEFRGELFSSVEATPVSSLTVNTTRVVDLVLTEDKLQALKTALNNATVISYDLETDGLNKLHCNIVGVALSVEEDKSWYIPVGHSYIGVPVQLTWAQVKEAIEPSLENEFIRKCGQNIKFDNTILERNGITIKGELFDTMVAAYCIDPGRTSFGLKDMAGDYFQEKMTRIDEVMGKKKDVTFVDVPIEIATSYAGADAEVTLRLMRFLEKKLIESGQKDLFYKLEMPLVAVIQEMEKNGISIDVNYLKAVGAQFEKERQSIETEIFELAGERFTLNSPKQLAKILFDKLKLPPGRKTKTGFSTDEDVLLKLAKNHPICEKIIACRELSKLISTYVNSTMDLLDSIKNRVHTSFHQTGTITGRLSSSNPNLQNIPIRTEKGRMIRKAFVASPGCVLLSADYSQIDLRSLAHMSGDPVLIRTFQEGGDVHTATASEMFQVPFSDVTIEQRRSAKAINFGIVYGQQPFALAQSLGIPIETAREFIEKYFIRYAGVRTWIDETLLNARKNLFVTTLSGRKRQVNDINAANSFTRGFAERVAVNTPIQGTSADIIKYAMIQLYDELMVTKIKSKMLVQVHDELLFDVPQNELRVLSSMVKRAMEGAYALKVPLVADIKIGPNWNDMEKQ